MTEGVGTAGRLACKSLYLSFVLSARVRAGARETPCLPEARHRRSDLLRAAERDENFIAPWSAQIGFAGLT